MTKIIYISGGQRSGKSSYAQKLAESISPNPIYLATSRIWDDDFQARVNRHKKDRGEQWTTIEEEVKISKHNLNGHTVLLDCVTLWLTNIFYDNKYNIEKSLLQAKTEWNKFTNQDFTLIVVSNEIGMGVHAESEASRKFADLQGWVNQHIAKSSTEAWLMVSGIPLKLK